MSTAEISASLDVPVELLAFVRRMQRNSEIHPYAEKRSEEREPFVATVLAVPLDSEFNPVGNKFTVVSRDISSRGIGLVHSERLSHQLLGLQTCLAGEEVNLVAEIVWQKPMGPFEYIGCRFVSRLREFPA